VQSFAFGKRAAIPDTNVIRLLQRFFGILSATPTHRGAPGQITVQLAEDVLPERKAGEFNFAMLDFGATICVSRRPKCGSCPLLQHCQQQLT